MISVFHFTCNQIKFVVANIQVHSSGNDCLSLYCMSFYSSNNTYKRSVHEGGGSYYYPLIICKKN